MTWATPPHNAGYPGGVIGLREARRRKEVKVSASTLYTRALQDEARQEKRRK